MNNEHKNTAQQAAENAKNAEITTAKPQQRSKLKWLRGVFFLFLSLFGTLLIFLATGSGQRLAIKWLEQSLDALSIANVEGSIQQGLVLSDAHYVMDGVKVDVGQIMLQIDFSCLFKGEACVEKIAINNANIDVDTSKLPPSQSQPSKPFTELNLPFGVAVRQILLEQIQVKVDDTEIRLQHFNSGISGQGRALTLLPTNLSGLDILFTLKLDENDQQAVESVAKFTKNEVADSEAQSVADTIVKNTLEKTSEKVAARFKAQQIQQTAENRIDWAAIRTQLQKPFLDKRIPLYLPLDFSIPQLQIEKLNIAQKNQDQKHLPLLNVIKASLQAKSNRQMLMLHSLHFQSEQGNIDGQGALIFAANYPLAFHFQASEPKQTKIKLPISSLQATLGGELYGKTLLNIQTKGAVKADLAGDIAMAEAANPLNLTLNGDSIRYPFIPQKSEEPLKFENVRVALNGTPLDYALNLTLAMKGMNLPNSQFALKGKGGLTQFTFDELQINGLGGKAQLLGLVDWAQGVEWNADLNLNNINLKSLVADFPAILSGKLHSDGYAARGKNQNEWAVEVSDIDLKGQLQQKNLQLQGALKTDNNTLLDVADTRFTYGENQFHLHGKLGKQSQFSAQINAPNLQGLIPHFSAALQGNIQLSGKISQPNLNLDLTANNFSYTDFKAQQFKAKGQISSEKTVKGNLALNLRHFAYQDIHIDEANLTAEGEENGHNVKFIAKGNPIGANLQISGKFDRLQQIWSGQLANFVIESQEFGAFKANQPINLNYQNKQISALISAHCWQNPKLNLCFPQAFNVGVEGKIPFEIARFDLADIQKYLADASQLNGIVNAKGDFAWFKNKQPQANLELNSNSIKFVQKMEGGKSLPLTVAPLKINAELAENNLKVKTDLNLENNGRIVLDALLGNVTDKRNLSGNIHLERINLKLAKPLLNAGESVEGNINAHLTMGGVASAPLLHGKLLLTDLKAKAVAMPFDITNGNLSVNFAGASSTLSGRVQTTESELRLEGEADWRNLSAWRTQIRAEANRFRLNIPNIAKLEFTPNISVTITPKELELGGTIDIPWARVEVEELPESAVSVSDDEVVMDGSIKRKIPLAQRQIPQNTASGMAIKADIKINIGNDVSLNAYGLKSDLQGIIAVKQGKQGLGLYGQVNLIKGRYASFGQDLIIRKGLISFAGPPSQPTLNIEAIRNPEAMEDSSITAGIKVYGLADSPEVKIFSEPSLSQNEALSYLLTGRSLESSGDTGSNNSMAAALLSMSLSKSSKTVGALGGAFGLKDLSVTTAGIGDNTKVEVSASLTPKFRIKYGVGIFAPLTELTLRYNLAPKLYLQWVSSINQAVDLMYRFEFD